MNTFAKKLTIGVISLVGMDLTASNKTSFWDEGSIPYRYTYEKGSKGKSIRDQKEFLRFAIKKDNLRKYKNPFQSIFAIPQKKAKINGSIPEYTNQKVTSETKCIKACGNNFATS